MPGLTVHVGLTGNAADALPRPAGFTRAMSRAVNKTAMQTRTAAVREVRAAGYNLKASTVRKALALTRARPASPVATLKARGAPVPLIEYDARPTNAGVTVRVKNGRKPIRHAFIATMDSGHTGVFVRIGTGHKRLWKRGRSRWSGLPIRELFGPSIPDAVGNAAVQAALTRLVGRKFPAILAHEMEWEAKKRG